MPPPPSKLRRKATTASATLASLGAPRLAELLAAAAKADRALARTLSLELSAHRGDLPEEIDRQIVRLGTGKGRLDARRATALARELQGLQGAIVHKLGVLDAGAALRRLFDLLKTSPAILARRSYDAEVLVETFRSAADAIPALLAAAAGAQRESYAMLAFQLYLDDELSLTTNLMAGVAAASDKAGRAALRSAATADLDALSGQGSRAKPARRPLWRLTQALEDLADADEDVDAFIAAERRRGTGANPLKIASRLLKAGRVPEAMATLETARPAPDQPSGALETLRIEVLEASNRPEDAQRARWRHFQSELSAPMLKAYLKRLPDFEDVQEETEALDWVLEHPNATSALSFLTGWPERRRAAALVRARYTALDGEDVRTLSNAAELLGPVDPLAATLLYRLMISDALRWRRKARFAEASRQLEECADLAKAIDDWDRWSPHETYVRRLRLDHPRNPKFWNRVALD